MFFLEEITKWGDDGSPVGVFSLDFQKAFDKVSHQRLLLKLKAHCIGNDVINWIEKWLTHRRQRVVVDGEISNWKSVLSGEFRVFLSATMDRASTCKLCGVMYIVLSPFVWRVEQLAVHRVIAFCSRFFCKTY